MTGLLINPYRFASPAPTGYAAEVLADSPLAYYRLGEPSGTTMTDSSGNSRNGTYGGGVTLGGANLLSTGTSTSADFDGSNDYASVANGAWMTVSNLTVEAMVRPDSVTGTRTIMARRQISSLSGQAWQFRFGPTVQLLGLYSGGSVVTAESTTSLVAGSTYHVAATYDGSTIRIYINGTLDASLAHAGGFNTSTSSLFLGGIDQGGGAGLEEKLDGRLQEVAFYGSALSAARIAAHYAAA